MKGIQGGHASAAGGRDRLAILGVLHIPRREYAGHIRGRAVARKDVTLLVRLHLSLKGRGIRHVADGHEDAVALFLEGLPGLRILQAHTGHPFRVLPENLVHHRIPDHLDLRILHDPFLHDLRRPELVPPVYDANPGRKVRQDQGLFACGVPAADHHHLLVFEEKPVARGAGRHAPSHKSLLAGQAEEPCRGAARDDQAPAGILLPVRPNAEGALGKVHLDHFLAQAPGPEPHGLLLDRIHQVLSQDPLRKPGKILHLAGDRKLPPRLSSLEHDRLQVGSRRVDGRGQTRCTASDNQHIFHTFFLFHLSKSSRTAADSHPMHVY